MRIAALGATGTAAGAFVDRGRLPLTSADPGPAGASAST